MLQSLRAFATEVRFIESSYHRSTMLCNHPASTWAVIFAQVLFGVILFISFLTIDSQISGFILSCSSAHSDFSILLKFIKSVSSFEFINPEHPDPNASLYICAYTPLDNQSKRPLPIDNVYFNGTAAHRHSSNIL